MEVDRDRFRFGDGDTELPGSFTLERDLERELSISRRSTKPFSLLLFALTGEALSADPLVQEPSPDPVKKTAQLLKKNLREHDALYRYNENIFALLMPEVGLKQALTAAQGFNCNLRSAVTSINGQARLICNIGVASFDARGEGNSTACVQAAIRALEQAANSKNDGIGACAVSGARKAMPKLFLQADVEALRKRSIKGIPLVAGLATGKIHHQPCWTVSHRLRERPVALDSTAELARLKRGLAQSIRDIAYLQTSARELGEIDFSVFEFHKTILSDAELIRMIREDIRAWNTTAAHAAAAAFNRWIQNIRNHPSPFLKDKEEDLQDALEVLLRNLEQHDRFKIHAPYPKTILVIRRLLPSHVVEMDTRHIKAVITGEGSMNSHSAILTRNLNIPVITNPQGGLEVFQEGETVIINGERGNIIVQPTAEEIRQIAVEEKRRRRQRRRQEKAYQHVATTWGGERVVLSANVLTANDILNASRYGADGIGLLRLEGLFMLRKRMPLEDDLYQELASSLVPMKGKPVTIRLLDIGADKQLPYFRLDPDQKSPLGLRGIRLLMHFPGLLRVQIRVCLRLAREHQVKILIPMVTLTSEVIRVRRIIDRETEDLRSQGMEISRRIELGAMIETPNACLLLPALLRHLDFVSIGTNDLIQYLMVADRDNHLVAGYYHAGMHSILRIIGHIVRQVRRKNRECSLCGEVAGDQQFTQALMRRGIRHLSVIPSRIPEMKAFFDTRGG